MRPHNAGFCLPFTAKSGLHAAMDTQLAVNDAPNARIIGPTLFREGLFAALRAHNTSWRVCDGRMDVLVVTIDMFYAAIDRHYAAK